MPCPTFPKAVIHTPCPVSGPLRAGSHRARTTAVIRRRIARVSVQLALLQGLGWRTAQFGADLRIVRDERDRLKAKVQRGLGQQVDQAGSAELVARI